MSLRLLVLSAAGLFASATGALADQPDFFCQGSADTVVIVRKGMDPVDHEISTRKGTGDLGKDCSSERRESDVSLAVGGPVVSCLIADGKAVVTTFGGYGINSDRRRFVLRDTGDSDEKCSSAALPGDVVLADDTFGWGEPAIMQGRLLINKSEGGWYSGFVVFDLTTGAKVAEAETSGVASFDADKIVYFQRAGTATKADCADYDELTANLAGSPVGKDVETIFDFATGKTSQGTATRCSPAF